MRGLVFTCDEDSHFPIGATYNNSLYRVCNLPGALPGETTVRGEVYLKEAFDFDVDTLSIDIIAILLFWILFTVINAVAVEKIEWTHGGFMRKLYKRGKAPKPMDDAAEMEMTRKAELATQNMKPMEVVRNLTYLPFLIPSSYLTITRRKQAFSCGVIYATELLSLFNQMEPSKDSCLIMFRDGSNLDK